jgi:hypothetical protein
MCKLPNKTGKIIADNTCEYMRIKKSIFRIKTIQLSHRKHSGLIFFSIFLFYYLWTDFCEILIRN